uniref:Uncharacterized protein n=1 Tax=Aegilops tauschii TaxID=37682 RepID=N1QVG4_AEGTA
MRKAKRGGDHLTRSFPKSRKASKNESLVSSRFLGDCDQGVRSRLSDGLISYLSRSVASITLCNGDTVLFSCSGIAIERQGRYHTRFLTSASFVRALNGTNKDHDDLKVGANNHPLMICLLLVGSFQPALEIRPHGELLVVIGRGVSGEIMAKNVELDGDSRVSEDAEDLDCKISETWEGGPLLSVDGKVVGMNLFLTTRRAVFLPWGTILKHLEDYWISQQKKTGLARPKTSEVYRYVYRCMSLCSLAVFYVSSSHKRANKVVLAPFCVLMHWFGPFYILVSNQLVTLAVRPTCVKSNSHPEAVHGDLLNQEQLDLDSMGYPKLPSSMLGAGMILVDTFEETFGDIHGEGVWRKFTKSASNINRNVVALASFNGSLVRNSGDENKIVENLRVGAPCSVAAVLLSAPPTGRLISSPRGAAPDRSKDQALCGLIIHDDHTIDHDYLDHGYITMIGYLDIDINGYVYSNISATTPVNSIRVVTSVHATPAVTAGGKRGETRGRHQKGTQSPP